MILLKFRWLANIKFDYLTVPEIDIYMLQWIWYFSELRNSLVNFGIHWPYQW
jgi:hypothetical protein